MKKKMELAIKYIKETNQIGIKEKIRKQRDLFFKEYDHQLDACQYGKCYLKDSEIADIVQKKLHELDGDKYDLITYSIMPNHVHVLIDTMIQLVDEQGLIMNEIPEGYTQLKDIMKLIKGNTAYKSNKALGRQGKFWQKDSFDRYIRDEKELEATINYILQNPVKAGLVEHWWDYPYNYLKDLA